MTAALTYWRCLTCPAHGSYIEPDTKTDTSPPAKHGHATLSASREWAAGTEAAE